MLTFESMGDLPNEWFEKPSGDHLTLDDLSRLWSDPRLGSTTLINNTGPIVDTPVAIKSSAGGSSSPNSQQIVRNAQRHLMAGMSLARLHDWLSLECESNDYMDIPEIRNLVASAGLLGNVFLVRSAFKNCDDLGRFWKENRNRNAEFLMCDTDCHHCPLNAGRCPKIGLIVTDSIEYTPELMTRYASKLSIMGKCKSAQKISSVDDLQAAFLKDFTPATSVPVPKRITKPVLSSDLISDTLEKMAKEKSEKQLREHFSNEAIAIRPILRSLHEILLSGVDMESVKTGFRRRAFASDLIQKYSNEIRVLLSDTAVRAGLKVIPGLYDTCDALATFLHKNQSLKPQFSVKRSKCTGCNHNNGIGCRTLGTKFYSSSDQLQLTVAKNALESLKEKNYLSNDEAQLFSKTEGDSPGQGIRKAFQLIDSRKSRMPVKSFNAIGQKLNANNEFVLSVESGVDQVDSLLRTGKSLAEIGGILKPQWSKVQTLKIVESALWAQKTIRANQIDHCKSGRHNFDPKCKLQKSSKCTSCSLQDGFKCTAQQLVFTDEFTDTLTDANRESRETQSFFNGSEMVVNIDPKIKRPEIDVELKNESGEWICLEDNPLVNDPLHGVLPKLSRTDISLDIDAPPIETKPIDINLTGGDFDPTI